MADIDKDEKGPGAVKPGSTSSVGLGAKTPTDTNSSKIKEVPSIDEESAQAEVNKFLDLKRISPRKRSDTFDQQIKDLVGLMLDNRLTFDFDKKRARFILNSPLRQAEAGNLEHLDLRFYIGVQEANMVLKNIEAQDSSARSVALAAALSGQNPNALKNSLNDFGDKGLDMSDHNSLFAYTLFFLA